MLGIIRCSPRETRFVKSAGERERNTYRLPTGAAIRRELVTVFREQRRQMLAFLGRGAKDDQIDRPHPEEIEWPEFRLGALAMSERMVPLIAALWDVAGQRFLSRIALDPDRWDATNPHTRRMIEQAALDFCQATNETTKLQLDQAKERLRAALIAGTVTRGETVDQLTDRVNEIFGQAERSRARRIATSEASRAVHAAQETAAQESGVVAGWEWLLSADACPLCQTVGRRAKFVRLGQPFATVGAHPAYSEVRHPPLHPSCQCSMVEVLKEDYGGEPEPQWNQTLDQPQPEAEDRPPAREPKPNDLGRPAAPVAPIAPPAPKPIQHRIADYGVGDAKVAHLVTLNEESEQAFAEYSALSDQFEALTDRLPSSEEATPEQRKFRDDFSRRVEAARQKWQTAIDAIPIRLQGILKVPAKDRIEINGIGGSKHPASPEIAQAEQFLRKVVAKGSSRTKVELTYRRLRKGGRASYHPDTRELKLAADNGHTVVVHEWGHAIEHQVPGIHARCKEFLAYRTQGEPLSQFKKVLPGRNFAPHEKGRKDHFDLAFGADGWYVGKDYEVIGIEGTEILSMGIEKLLKDPVGFAKKDPEYCKFVLGILDGELR